MATVGKNLREYMSIYENRENATIEQLGEAATYFEGMGGKFSEKAQDLKKCLAKYTQQDMFNQLGSNTETFSIGADDYQLAGFTTTKRILDKKALMKLSSDPAYSKYFSTVVVLNEDALFNDKSAGLLPPSIDALVSVSTQMGLALRKKPVRKGGSK